MQKFTPTDIAIHKKDSLMTITWADGHTSQIPFALLRNACPCAECAGGHENMRSDPNPDVFFIPLHNSRETELVDVQPVGNYAITITWGDGHKYGIYQWAYLRKLDPEEAGQG